jgi:hypothetical protein
LLINPKWKDDNKEEKEQLKINYLCAKVEKVAFLCVEYYINTPN